MFDFIKALKMAVANIIFLAVILAFASIHDSVAYKSYGQAFNKYRALTQNRTRSRPSRESEFYKSLAFRPSSDVSQCLTRDSSGDNQSYQIIIEPCVYGKRRNPWKLEVAKIKGSTHIQLSQAFRPENKPHGVAGCLIPERGGVYASVASCNSRNSHWEMKKIFADRNLHQLVHVTSRKCMSAPNNGVGVTTGPCNSKDQKQLWAVDINT